MKKERNVFVFPEPTLEVVNNRVLCVAKEPDLQANKSGIITLGPTTMMNKAGKFSKIPRFFVAKTSNDLPLYREKEGTEEGKMGSLPFGSEVFPFIPPAESFAFPIIYDYNVQVGYIMLEWMEIAAYLLPENASIECRKPENENKSAAVIPDAEKDIPGKDE